MAVRNTEACRHCKGIPFREQKVCYRLLPTHNCSPLYLGGLLVPTYQPTPARPKHTSQGRLVRSPLMDTTPQPLI